MWYHKSATKKQCWSVRVKDWNEKHIHTLTLTLTRTHLKWSEQCFWLLLAVVLALKPHLRTYHLNWMCLCVYSNRDRTEYGLSVSQVDAMHSLCNRMDINAYMPVMSLREKERAQCVRAGKQQFKVNSRKKENSFKLVFPMNYCDKANLHTHIHISWTV